eukprot:4149346-Pleurochrysis_carterae.AAC.2
MIDRWVTSRVAETAEVVGEKQLVKGVARDLRRARLSGCTFRRNFDGRDGKKEWEHTDDCAKSVSYGVGSRGRSSRSSRCMHQDAKMAATPRRSRPKCTECVASSANLALKAHLSALPASLPHSLSRSLSLAAYRSPRTFFAHVAHFLSLPFSSAFFSFATTALQVSPLLLLPSTSRSILHPPINQTAR